MRDKILKTEIAAAAERIARALRAYSGQSMSCDLYVVSHNTSLPGDNDFYSIEVSIDGEESVNIIKQGAKITYSFDAFEGEKIKSTKIVFGGAEDE